MSNRSFCPAAGFRNPHRIRSGLILYGSSETAQTISPDPVSSIILHRLYYRPVGPLIEIIQLLHVLPTQLKVINARILLDPTGRVALRQRHPSFLETVPDEDLCCRFAVFLPEGDKRGIVDFLRADERGIGFDDDAVLVAVGDYGPLLAPGM